MFSLNSKKYVPPPKQVNLCLVWSRIVLLCHQTDFFHLFWFISLSYFFSFWILGTDLAVALHYSICKFTFCLLWSLPLILHVFPCLLLACSMGFSATSGCCSLASGCIRLPFWTGKCWKLIPDSKTRLCVFWVIWSFRPLQLQRWPVTRFEGNEIWPSSFCGGMRSAAQCGAVLGEQPTLALRAGAIKAEISPWGELSTKAGAHWPPSRYRCPLRAC